MAQQRGVKRAQKVMKRKQRLVREGKKSNIKQAIYAFEKALKASDEHTEHVHDENCKHD
ncbi:MAG: hypothetical protein K2X27_20815 [Candidatus Obscuribacterales bacterium]|nr:hypothetical protein [Candidatus Obscuribacterales bacterium]